jgi:hypothetical protein
MALRWLPSALRRGADMAQLEPGELYSPEPNILERRAARYLAGWSADAGLEPQPRVQAEARELAATTRRQVTLAALAGIVSGGLIGGAEIWVRQGWLDGMEDLDWQEQLPYWGGFFAFAGLISAIEIVYLYWLALRGVATVSGCAGLAIGERGYPGLFGRGLARSALEFPNPRVLILGIDPYAYVSGWRLLAKNVAYKMKVGVSSFLLRVFLRRVLARVAIRGILPLIAGPLYAAWNAIIVWRIMHEARIRALAPSAIERFVAESVDEAERPDEAVGDLMLRGAAEMLKRNCDAHPNHVHLLLRLREALGREGDIEDDWAARAPELRELAEPDRRLVLATLTLAAIIGSRVTRRQRAMLREACDGCGTTFQRDALKNVRQKLKNGAAVTTEHLAKVCG